ncbi:MAG: type II secretion system F family protein [Chloroflexi bacterium]|nr:type II secretion system F family protein [Chloroflexota bacterium]
MSLIVTPRQLTHLGEFYHQLAGLISAGIGLIQGLEAVRKSPPHRSFRPPLSRIIDRLNQGYRLSESLTMLGRWLPSFDIALIQAGEQSGRLDACFRLLAEYYKERAQLARNVISDLMYPVFVFHLAVLIFPTSLLTRLVWQGEVWPFLWAKTIILLPVYAAVFFLAYAGQGRRGEMWRTWVERVTNLAPLLGAARRSLALARLSAALEALISAGVSIIEAWDLASMVSGSPALRRAVAAGKPRLVHSGDTPGEVISDNAVFPELFANLYRTGELSGQLDQTLRHLHKHYQEEGARKLKAVAQWTPRLVYFGLILMVAYQIISFYSGYFQQVNQIGF